MSIVNLGLQCIGLERKEMGAEFERKASEAKSLKDLRHLAEREPGFRESAIDSMASVKVKLTQILLWLKLKDKDFKVFTSASSQELDKFCTALLVFDASLDVSIKKGQAGQYPRLQAFIQHCCHQRHYFLTSWNVAHLNAISANQWGYQRMFFSSCIICLTVLLVQMDIFHIRHTNHRGTPTILQSKENGKEVTAFQC